MVKRKIVKEFSRKARLLEGSGYIATEKFLIRLLPFVEKASALVDYGAGIGTISAFALQMNNSLQILAVEEDDWCRKEFTKNLDLQSKKSIQLVEKLEVVDEKNLPQNAIWVIDVEQTFDDVTKILKANFSSIWVEGHRFNQRKQILEIASLNRIGLKYISFLGGINSPKGGCYFTMSNFSLIRSILMKVQSWRITVIVALKFPIIEWELRTRILQLLKNFRKFESELH